MSAMSSLVSNVRKAPWLGIAAYVMVFLSTPLAHAWLSMTLYAMEQVFPMMGLDPESRYWIGWVFGGLGVWLVYSSFRDGMDDITASFRGWFGAQMIWVNWVEFGLPWMTHANILALTTGADGKPVLPSPEFGIAYGSIVYLIPVMIFLGLNKDTRCRMFLFIRRHLGLKPGKPTANYRPQPGRIAAFEQFMVNWFMYIVTFILIDKRIWGYTSTVKWVSLALFTAWAIYLLYLQSQQRDMGFAIRYAIPCANIGWFNFEIAALLKIYPAYYNHQEPWIRPDLFPLTNLIMLGIFLGAIWLVLGTAKKVMGTPAAAETVNA